MNYLIMNHIFTYVVFMCFHYDYTGSYDTSAIEKKARLVVTTEYAIE